jgi:predicted DCC family thiol-disulfide oxidoreductase YuxK
VNTSLDPLESKKRASAGAGRISAPRQASPADIALCRLREVGTALPILALRPARATRGGAPGPLAWSVSSAPPDPAVTPLAPRLVLFDGVCVFCNGAVRWLIARDPDATLRFAPLQGEAGAALCARHPEIPTGIDTIVYVDASRGGERVYLRSEAVFRLLRELPRAPRWLLVFAVLPRWLTDLGYRAFARLRYRLFGRYESCPLPTREERARILP